MSSHPERRVRIETIVTGVSSQPTGRKAHHALTAFDHAMSRRTLRAVFYYEQNPFRSFDLDPMRVHLSEVLTLHPPVMGRITRGESGSWEVKCNDAGVRLLRATVAASLEEWLKAADGEEERDLALWEEMPEDPSMWSPFRIQVNEFEGGGAAIAMSCTPMLADFTTLTLLFRAWTEANRCKPITHPPSFSPPPLVPQSINGAVAYGTTDVESKSRAHTPVKTATATFKFSDSSLKSRLQELQRDCPEATPFDFLAALFWRRITSHKDDRRGPLTVGLDFRRRLNDPLPHGFFGNVTRFSTLSIDHAAMDDLSEVVRAISHHLASLGDEEWLEPTREAYGHGVTCLSLDRVIGDDQASMADLTFFDGKPGPVHASYSMWNVVDGERMVVVGPSPEGGFGRTVSVALPAAQVVGLLADPEILSLGPELLLCGGRSAHL